MSMPRVSGLLLLKKAGQRDEQTSMLGSSRATMAVAEPAS